jgi:RNA polymerase sigma-70 factor (ECF subfamily)
MDAGTGQPDADDGRIVINEVTVAAFRGGSHGAVERIFAASGGRVRNYLWMITGSLETAEELAQETFLIAFRQRARLRDDDRLVSWLFGIARNLGLKELRRRRRRPEYLLSEEGLGMLEEEPSNAPGPDSGLARDHTLRILKEALKELREIEQEMIVLRFFVHLPLKEVADTLGVPLGSVGTTLQRGLAKMKTILDDRGLGLEDLMP